MKKQTRTMPWSNSGLRLLPTSKYFKYHQTMTALQMEDRENEDEDEDEDDYCPHCGHPQCGYSWGD